MPIVQLIRSTAVKRNNVTSWSHCLTLTRRINVLTEAMMKYQMYTWPHETRGQGCLGGDMDVIIAAIQLRDQLDSLIKESRDANG